MEHRHSDAPPLAKEAFFRALMQDASDSALLFFDPAGHVLASNVRAERLLGYPAEELRGQHYSRLFFRPEESRRGEPEYELHKAEAQGRVDVAHWYSRRDGTTFWGAGALTPL